MFTIKSDFFRDYLCSSKEEMECFILDDENIKDCIYSFSGHFPSTNEEITIKVMNGSRFVEKIHILFSINGVLRWSSLGKHRDKELSMKYAEYKRRVA